MHSTRFTQAVNAGFVLIQLLYLMHQFFSKHQNQELLLSYNAKTNSLQVELVLE